MGFFFPKWKTLTKWEKKRERKREIKIGDQELPKEDSLFSKGHLKHNKEPILLVYEKPWFMLALFMYKILYVMYFFDILLLSGFFHVSWGSVFESLFEDRKLHQPKISLMLRLQLSQTKWKITTWIGEENKFQIFLTSWQVSHEDHSMVIDWFYNHFSITWGRKKKKKTQV